MSIKSRVSKLKKDIRNLPTYMMDLSMLNDDELSILIYWMSNDDVQLPKVFEDKFNSALESGKRKGITREKFLKENPMTPEEVEHYGNDNDEQVQECKKVYERYIKEQQLE
jgi:hypothetical protein